MFIKLKEGVVSLVRKGELCPRTQKYKYWRKEKKWIDTLTSWCEWTYTYIDNRIMLERYQQSIPKRRNMIKNKTTEQLAREVEEYGLSIEAIYHNLRFVGYGEQYDERRNIPNIKRNARLRIAELEKRIKDFDSEYIYVTDAGEEIDLGYALQFI